MQKNTLRNAIGVVFILSHVGIFALLGYLHHIGGFDDSDLGTALSITVPIFAGYITAIVAYVIKFQAVLKPRPQRVNGMFVFVGLFLPLAFIAFIVITIFRKSSGELKIAQFQMYMAATETLLAAYVGAIMTSLYNYDPTKGDA